MRVCVVGKGFFYSQGQKRINTVLIAATMLALVGCSHSNESAQFSMAPPPPVFDPNAPEIYGPSHIMAFSGQPVQFPSNITLSDTGMPGQEPDYFAQRAALSSESETQGCKAKDRIDRDSLLAYQWGQNRVGLNVRGLDVMDYEGIKTVKLEYKLRLQPHKTKKEKCRYNSNWQGTIGSAYNEMFVREKDTVWKQLDDATNQVEEAFDKLF